MNERTKLADKVKKTAVKYFTEKYKNDPGFKGMVDKIIAGDEQAIVDDLKEYFDMIIYAKITSLPEYGLQRAILEVVLDKDFNYEIAQAWVETEYEQR